MGLLDDAIREHLDLKRRRGADPTEVERDEREALGPVKRKQPQSDTDLEEALETEEAGAFDEADDEDWAYEDDPRGEAAADVEEPGESAPFDAEERRDPAPFDRDDDPYADADFEPAPSRGSQRLARPEPDLDEDRPPPAGDETRAFDVESALGAEDDPAEESAPAGKDTPAGEDVLEETPDFLQDTPDHDRLWFEQRPPKDFDFDG
jgi:hypothetical protein